VLAFGITGQHFFEEGKCTVTVSSARYRAMLKTLDGELWVQHGRATAQMARESMDCVRAMFPGRIISRFDDIAWPARSPDLSAPDYLLWGNLKAEVYTNKPRTLELKERIRDEIRAIDKGCG
jgi:hypothetical protein